MHCTARFLEQIWFFDRREIFQFLHAHSPPHSLSLFYLPLFLPPSLRVYFPTFVSSFISVSIYFSRSFLFYFNTLSFIKLSHTHTHTHTQSLSLSLSLFLSLSFLKTSKITLNPSISSYNIFCYPLRSFCPSSLSFHLSFVNSLQKLSLKIHTQTLSIIHTKDKHTHTQTCIMVEYANICLDVDPFNKIVWENKT